MYYKKILSFNEILEHLGNLPNYLLEEYIFDTERKTALQKSLEILGQGGSIIITGRSGCGKTALMAIILSKILQTTGKVGALKEGVTITGEHIREGIVIFYDDLNKLDERTLGELAKTRLWIATLREEEYHKILTRVPEILKTARIIKISPMKKDYLQLMLEKYAYREGVIISPEAKQKILEKALIDADRGLPQYIWLVIRDARIRGITQITLEFTKEIPRSILSYTETIIARAIRDAEWDDKITTLAILFLMADSPGYAMDEELIYELYELATGKSGSQALANIVRYLLRSGGKLKIPHDSWIDVLRKPEILKYEISRAKKRYEKLKELVDITLARIQAMENKVKHTQQTLLTTQIKEISEKLEKASKEVMIEKPSITIVPTATLGSKKAEYKLKQIRRLTGIGIERHIITSNRRKNLCTKWQDYLANKKNCLKPKIRIIQILSTVIAVAIITLLMAPLTTPQITPQMLWVYQLINVKLNWPTILILSTMRILALLGVLTAIFMVLAPAKMTITKRRNEQYKGGFIGLVIGLTLSMIFGFVLGFIPGLILGGILGMIIGIVLGEIFGLIFGSTLGGFLGGILSMIISEFWLLNPVVWFLYVISTFIIIYLNQIRINFWLNFASLYFAEMETLEKSIINLILNRTMNIEDAIYLHKLFSAWGFNVESVISLNGKTQIIKIPNEYSYRDINKALLINFIVRLPILDNILSNYFKGIEFALIALKDISKSLNIDPWVLKLAERLSRNYIIIDKIFCYLNDSAIKRLYTEPLDLLSKEWQVDISVLRIIKENLLQKKLFRE